MSIRNIIDNYLAACEDETLARVLEVLIYYKFKSYLDDILLQHKEEDITTEETVFLIKQLTKQIDFLFIESYQIYLEGSAQLAFESTIQDLKFKQELL